jgi:hypothetical protein
MTEIISNIEEVTDYDCTDENGHISSYEGYIVTTNKRKILCLITSFQNCCENTGYLSTPDNTDEFIGSELISYEVVEIDNDHDGDVDVEDKININTSNGLLQLSVYQQHNGYYGHGVVVREEAL